MHKALLYEKLDGDRVRCDTCQWRCKIAPEKSGVCRVYRNKDGELYSLSYGRVSSVAVDPIEKAVPVVLDRIDMMLGNVA